MLHDSVLRCLVAVKHGGIITNEIIDAVREGESMLLVLEWGMPDGAQEGLSPRQCVEIPLSEIETESDSVAGYEIISHTGIDLDAVTVTDVASVTTKLFLSVP